jgi:hypothetical protein
MKMNDPFGGIEPASEPLRYPPHPPSFSRPCIECGRMHDTILQEMTTGKVLETFDQCRDCMMESWFKSCKNIAAQIKSISAEQKKN